MVESVGYGKVILFGEHFVVHGVPAIAGAVKEKTTAVVKKAQKPGIVLDDQRPATPGYKNGKLEHQQDSFKRILAAMGINPLDHKLKITLAGDLVAASGAGASGASCTAIVRALSNHFKMNLSDERVNETAFEGEKGYHGNPSGIDNTVSTFGGLIWYVRDKPPVMEKINVPSPLLIVKGDTGLIANTKAAVAGVRERKEEDPGKYSKIFGEAKKIVFDARAALESSNLQRVGELMNYNHQLLQEIEVSCKELDELVDIARENGALGTKLTGGGLGGNMVALAPDKKTQNKIAKAFEAAGYKATKTQAGV